MNEDFEVYLSSFKGVGTVGDFTVNYDTGRRTDGDWYVALSALGTTLSWFNISEALDNNKLRVNLKDKVIPDGSYGYSELAEVLSQFSEVTDGVSLSLTKSLRVVVELKQGVSLEIGDKFAKLLGMKRGLYSGTVYGEKVANITNDVDYAYVSLITNFDYETQGNSRSGNLLSERNFRRSNVIFGFSLSNFRRRGGISIQPTTRNWTKFLPNAFSSLHVKLHDENGRVLNPADYLWLSLTFSKREK